jgi:hypothetical protein
VNNIILLGLLAFNLLATQPSRYEGWLSAYNQNPTVATVKYRQGTGEIPADLSPYDGVIAVLDCGLVGEDAYLHTKGGTFYVMIFDCAGNDGGYSWMIENSVVAEVDYFMWEEHPRIVGSWAQLELVHKENKK